MGKGSPPPSYFRSLEKGKGKGSPFRTREDEDGDEEVKGKGQEKGKEKGGKGKEDDEVKGKGRSEKGRSVPSSHGVPDQGLGLTSSTMSPPSSSGGRGGKGCGKHPDFPDLCGGKGNGGRDPVFITPYGSRFHTRQNCPSLHNTRLLLPSFWCEHCSQDGGEFATIASPGEVAHASSVCPQSDAQKGVQEVWPLQRVGDSHEVNEWLESRQRGPKKGPRVFSPKSMKCSHLWMT